MSVNRTEAKQIIDEIALHFAKKFKFEKFIKQGTHYGIWDAVDLGGFGSVRDGEKEVKPIPWRKGAMSSFFEKHYGVDAVTEYRWISEDGKSYIEVRPRFSYFCIAIHMGKHMGEIEIGAKYPCDDEDINYLRDENGKLLESDENNYIFKELHVFYDKGIEFTKMLLKEWDRRLKAKNQ